MVFINNKNINKNKSFNLSEYWRYNCFISHNKLRCHVFCRFRSMCRQLPVKWYNCSIWIFSSSHHVFEVRLIQQRTGCCHPWSWIVLFTNIWGIRSGNTRYMLYYRPLFKQGRARRNWKGASYSSPNMDARQIRVSCHLWHLHMCSKQIESVICGFDAFCGVIRFASLRLVALGLGLHILAPGGAAAD